MNKKYSDTAVVSSSVMMESEYSRILTAAVVNSRFREMLLANPDVAISSGYAGEVFHLGNEEKQRLASIRATSLADFARQLTQVTASSYACAV